MKLSHYLRQNRITINKFIKSIGLKSRASLYRYMNGERMPDEDLLIRICAVTKGQVSANDFMLAPAHAKSKTVPGIKWGRDCVLSTKFEHSAIYEREYYMQFLEQQSANENWTFPLWQAAKILRKRVCLKKNGQWQLDGRIATQKQIIASANEILKQSGKDLILYPTLVNARDHSAPNFKILR